MDVVPLFVSPSGWTVILPAATLILVLAAAAGVYLFYGTPAADRKKKSTVGEEDVTHHQQPHHGKKHAKTKSTRHHPLGAASPPSVPQPDFGTSHPLHACTLKGFAHHVTSIGGSNTRVVAASSDSQIRVFDITDAKHQCCARGVVPRGDYLTAVDISCCGRYIFGAAALSCKLVKFEIPHDEDDGKNKGVAATMMHVGESAMVIYKANTVRTLSASKGHWIVMASDDDETTLRVYSYGLEELASVDTKQVKVFNLAVSPSDGRFFGAAAWAPGVKVYEIQKQKENDREFRQLGRALDLKSDCGVNALAFSYDNRRAVVACKDGTLILWDIDVRYTMSEDPKRLHVRKQEHHYTHLAFVPTGKHVLAVCGKSIDVLDATTLELMDTIVEAHGPAPVRSLHVGSSFALTSAADHKPRVWHLPSVK